MPHLIYIQFSYCGMLLDMPAIRVQAILLFQNSFMGFVFRLTYGSYDWHVHSPFTFKILSFGRDVM